MAEPVLFAADRSIAVPPGAIVKTGYVPIEDVILACRERMGIGDVDRAYQKRLQLGDHQAFVAALMLGCAAMLVAWVEGRTAHPAKD